MLRFAEYNLTLHCQSIFKGKLDSDGSVSHEIEICAAVTYLRRMDIVERLSLLLFHVPCSTQSPF